MQRRTFIKSLSLSLAAIPLVRLPFGRKARRERIYLRGGEELRGRVFTRDVSVFASDFARITDCELHEATMYLHSYDGGPAKNLTITNCLAFNKRKCAFVFPKKSTANHLDNIFVVGKT